MAFVPTIAQNTNIALVKGNSYQLKLIPKNPDGTVFDCTGINNANLEVLSDATTATNLGTIGLTVGTADATGVIVTMSPANVTSVGSVLGTNRGVYTIGLGDGTDTLNGAYGNLAVQFTGQPDA